MHGLTGGSWKRDTDRATAAEKNDPRETGRSPRLRAYRRSSSPRQLPTLHRMSSGSPTFRLRCWRWRYPSRMAVGHEMLGRAHDRGQGRANSGGREAGGEGRADLPLRLLWLPAGTGRRWMRWGHAGQRCWKYDWVIDLDIQKFFDTVLVGPGRQGGGGAHRSAVGAAVCASGGCGRRCSSPTGR